jgi:hypothetical protein
VASEIKNAFNCCQSILEKQLISINPYRIVIGIISVYDSGIVQLVLDKIGMTNRFIGKRIGSPFRGGKEGFVENITNVWETVR